MLPTLILCGSGYALMQFHSTVLIGSNVDIESMSLYLEKNLLLGYLIPKNLCKRYQVYLKTPFQKQVHIGGKVKSTHQRGHGFFGKLIKKQEKMPNKSFNPIVLYAAPLRSALYKAAD